MKNCLITCATSELGKSLSQHLATKYDNLVLTARNLSKLESILNRDDKKNLLANIQKIYLDFVDIASVKEIQTITKEKLDAVVLILPKIPAKDTSSNTDNEWEELFKLIFIRPLILLESLIPSLKMAGKSKVVLISGISSKQYLGNYSINGAIRAAWVAQMKAMSQEYGKFGICFNTISFGGILTETFMHKLEQEAKEKNEDLHSVLSSRYGNVPLKKYASLNEVCNAVEGLLSSATDHITGQNIICDGGFIRCY